MQYLVTFASTHEALRAEDLLDTKGLNPVIIPTPREISVSCGLAIALSDSAFEIAVALFKEEGVDFSKIFRVDKPSGAKVYQEIEEECLRWNN